MNKFWSKRWPRYQQAEFHQRRIDTAQRRFCSALRTLAGPEPSPAVQLNIAENQINVSVET
ncbi:MAG: hypothetical protein WKF75_16040 [Singulisphaera sp.]